MGPSALAGTREVLWNLECPVELSLKRFKVMCAFNEENLAQFGRTAEKYNCGAT